MYASQAGSASNGDSSIREHLPKIIGHYQKEARLDHDPCTDMSLLSIHKQLFHNDNENGFMKLLEKLWRYAQTERQTDRLIVRQTDIGRNAQSLKKLRQYGTKSGTIFY